MEPNGDVALAVKAPDVAAAIDDWTRWLTHERRYSRHTLSAYSLDLTHFLRFLSGYLGKPVSLADLDTLQPPMSNAVKWYCRKALEEVGA